MNKEQFINRLWNDLGISGLGGTIIAFAFLLLGCSVDAAMLGGIITFGTLTIKRDTLTI